MRLLKNVMACALVAGMTVAMIGCSSKAPANTVFSIDDLEGKKIGVQLGTTGDIYATDEYGENSVERYNKGADAIQALKQGKIDCVVIDEQPALAFVEKNKDLKILEDEFTNEDYAISISKENTELKEKINAALAELKTDGTLDNIISNWIGEDAGKTPYTSPADVDRSNGTLTMATNAYFPPYETYDENQKVVGLDVDMAQAICDQLGMELKVEDMEFDSIITAVQSGKADIGVAGMTVTEERLESIDFTDSYTTSRQVIIVRSK